MLNPYTELKRVGYWRMYPKSSAFVKLPWPVEQADPTWCEAERERVVRYLRFAGRVHQAWFGHSRCRICSIDNGCQDMTDGTYVWPSGYAHYVEAHAVKPPEEFVKHVLDASP
jgi:hypothetical protein